MDEMKESSASTNGGTGGSVAGTSKADLKRGYSDMQDKPKDDWMTPAEPMPQGGFAGRPNGWER